MSLLALQKLATPVSQLLASHGDRRRRGSQRGRESTVKERCQKGRGQGEKRALLKGGQLGNLECRDGYHQRHWRRDLNTHQEEDALT